jgi:hypothetical protein
MRQGGVEPFPEVGGRMLAGLQSLRQELSIKDLRCIAFEKNFEVC